ncbi:hypothetical protein HY251_13540 [bacterium]|nr:hypothetical protein [bacterium]
MAGTGLLARVRDLVARAAQGPLDASEIAASASDLLELRARLERLAARGFEDAASLAPEVEELLAKLAPATVAA